MATYTTPGQPPTASEHESTHWLVRPETIRRLTIASAVLLAGLVAADFGVEHYGYFGVDGTFGFYAWFSLAAGLGGGVAAKVLGIFLRRPSDYYEPQGEPGDPGAWTEATLEAARHDASDDDPHEGDSHHGGRA